MQSTVIVKLMANTYTQSYFHLVFSVKNRNALILSSWKNELEKYIIGIIQNHGHKLLAINAMPDHIHILIGYNVNQLIPDLVEKIKTSSNAWIKKENKSNYKFDWQKGYGAFTNSHAQIDIIIQYIRSQQNHHKKKRFKEEYLEILRKNDIKYTDKYLFDFFEN